MPCFKPLSGYRSATTTAKGKRGIVFSKKHGYVDMPVEVPCGQCIGCRIDRSQQWATRISQEQKFHDQNSFLTLTYSPESLPRGATLVKRHLQLFFKRLRKHLGSTKIRYFACGEYGETTERPHYHVILFGYDFPDKKPHSKGTDNHQMFTSAILDRIWGYGQCIIGSVTWSSAAYVARYVIKKVNGERAKEHYKKMDVETGEIFDREPEYIVMSRKPGIGTKFYETYKTDLYPSDFAIVHGKRKKVPIFYDRKLEADDPKLLRSIKSRRTARAKKHADDQTPRRLAVREEVTQAKISTLKRKL